MTIADPKTSHAPQGKSWRQLLRAREAHPGQRSAPVHKPASDSVDLWIMSAVDTKTPPARTGTGDVLDSIVQQHLESAEGGAEADALDAARPSEITPAPAPVQPPPLLQQEIEMLLHSGDPSDSPPNNAADSAAASEALKTASAAALRAQPPELPIAKPAVSAAERDVLLAHQAPALAAETHPADRETEQKLSEAEGVLAEELSKLVADADSTARIAADAAAPISPQGTPEMPGTADTLANPTTEEPPESAAAALAAEMAASSATFNPPAEMAPAETPSAPAPAPAAGLISRFRHMGSDLALMAAQLVDWPFAWMEDLQKNIIGVAALMLALGGVVLWLFARWTN